MTLNRWKPFTAGLLVMLLTLAPMQFAFGQAALTAQGGIFGDFQVQPEALVEVPVEVRDVSDLYAIDIQIEFDPAVVQVEDADPGQEGIQPALGTFLDAGLTLYDEVDNEAGLVRFVMTQINPSEAKSGDGVVLVLYLRGVAQGESELNVTVLELSTRAGEAISVEPVSGSVTVSADAAESEATSFPVQDPSLLVPVPTIIPTEAPAPTASDPEGQSGDGLSADEQAGDENVASPESNHSTGQSTSSGSGFSLIEHWWVVLVVVVVVIGFGVFLRVTRK